MQWRRHFGAVGIMARISWVSASCVNSRFRGTGKTQVKPQQQFRGRSEMIPKSSIMFRFLLFQAQSACNKRFLAWRRLLFCFWPNLYLSNMAVAALWFTQSLRSQTSPVRSELQESSGSTSTRATGIFFSAQNDKEEPLQHHCRWLTWMPKSESCAQSNCERSLGSQPCPPGPIHPWDVRNKRSRWAHLRTSPYLTKH